MRSDIDSGRRAVAYTFQPRRASSSAVARPIPDEHPVTNTAFEASLIVTVWRAKRRELAGV
jgi:hypothetical protein